MNNKHIQGEEYSNNSHIIFGKSKCMRCLKTVNPCAEINFGKNNLKLSLCMKCVNHIHDKLIERIELISPTEDYPIDCEIPSFHEHGDGFTSVSYDRIDKSFNWSFLDGVYCHCYECHKNTEKLVLFSRLGETFYFCDKCLIKFNESKIISQKILLMMLFRKKFQLNNGPIDMHIMHAIFSMAFQINIKK